MTRVNMNRLWSGFEDPVDQAQRTFRAVLKALSEPGTRLELDAPVGDGEFAPAGWAILMTLADSDTPVWISPRLETGALTDNLRFHCGAPLTTEPEKAAFAVCHSDEPLDLDRFSHGDDADPHRSATLLMQVPSLCEGGRYRLSGPGIESQSDVRIDGLTDVHLRQLADNRNQFPAGIDLILVSDRQVLGLPRTTDIQPIEEAASCT